MLTPRFRSRPPAARQWLLAAACVAAILVTATLWTASARAQSDRARWTLGPLDEQGTVTYFIAPGEEGSHFRDADRELAAWALGAWQRAAQGSLKFVPAPEDTALVRVYWVAADGAGQYGEMRPRLVGGQRGASVYIRPDTDALGPEIAARARHDELFRDTIVYLTCVHELGHALGLEHTADFSDVMYFFGFGGDIPAFFGRYREQIDARGDIAGVSGLSDGDVADLRSLYRD